MTSRRRWSEGTWDPMALAPPRTCRAAARNVFVSETVGILLQVMIGQVIPTNHDSLVYHLSGK